MKIRVLILIGCSYLIAASSLTFIIGNNPPKIKITRPLDNSILSWNSMVPYSIEVIDLEDGNSQYGEIPNNEVLLSVRFLEDSIMISSYLSDLARQKHEPLLWISAAGCFNCHNAQQNLIGPSFEQIAAQYADQEQAADQLLSKVILGSTGHWGEQQMPAHPQLEKEKVRQMIQWIINNNLDPHQKFLAGTYGTFRTKSRPETTRGKAVYVLTAIYQDHGGDGQPETRKEGRHSIILNMEN